MVKEVFTELEKPFLEIVFGLFIMTILFYLILWDIIRSFSYALIVVLVYLLFQIFSNYFIRKSKARKTRIRGK